MACLLAKMAGRVEFEKFYSCFRQIHLANVAEMTQYLEENASHPNFETKLTFLRRCFYQNIADLNIATAKKIFELMMVEEHAKNAVVQEACKKGHNVDYVVVQTDISKIDFPAGCVGESHDAGTYKNENAYRMISKMQKKAYEEFKESIALAEFFVEMKANQTQKEAKQAEKEAKQTQKEANKKKRHGKKNCGKGRK